MSEYFWLAVALLVLIAIAWRPFQRNVIAALDARAERIRRELEEATRLREEAEAMLAEHRKRLERGEELTREIMDHARVEAERETRHTHEQLEETLRRRTDAAMDRIAREEARAVQEVRAQATELAMRATRRLLAERVDEARQRAMIDDAVAEVGRRLH